MNTLLFKPEERLEDGRVRIDDRRFEHVRDVLKKAVGDTLEVGEIGGWLGSALIDSLDESSMTLCPKLDSPPPVALDTHVYLALPRPKMLRRSLRALAEFGVKRITLIHSYHVDKSYWQTPFLRDAAIDATLRAGLEQSCDTLMPVVAFERRFRPFVEDRLPGLLERRSALLADPSASRPFPVQMTLPAALIIGPARGFTRFESDLIEQAGAQPVSLGARTLRVENALTATLGSALISSLNQPDS
ncbi:MAG: 16S rRNA (uracil(1498)-N(3))-methyltransferase [Pseudomonadota bacterium]